MKQITPFLLSFASAFLVVMQSYGQMPLDIELPADDVTRATFKSTRIVTAHSVETVAKKHLEFRISHRFGKINSGAYELWGLDQASIRLGFEYGVTDRFTVGLGRSSHQKVFDGFAKYKLIQQQTGTRNIPVTVTLLGTSTIQTLKVNENIYPDYPFTNRITYTAQVLVARKFSDRFSAQLSPTLVHRNALFEGQGNYQLMACGVGGRLKISKRTSFNAEYFYTLPDQLPSPYTNMLSLGFDIETGGHVFQLHCTNSQSMIEKGFVGETTGQWGKGDIFYGFNISRMFSFNKKEKKPSDI
jgi:Membrane bound beta barrel domain (DUF5777)